MLSLAWEIPKLGRAPHGCHDTGLSEEFSV
jgi:hypothetical protein